MVRAIIAAVITTAVAISIATITFVLSRIRAKVVVMLIDISGYIESRHCVG